MNIRADLAKYRPRIGDLVKIKFKFGFQTGVIKNIDLKVNHVEIELMDSTSRLENINKITLLR